MSARWQNRIVGDDFPARADKEASRTRTFREIPTGDRTARVDDLEKSGRRPRVAIIGTRGYPSFYGGFETAVRRLAPFLCDRGWDVTVYSREQGGDRSGGPV